MTLEVHVAELRAIDKMSNVFRSVGNEGRQLGQSLSQSMNQASESTRRFNVDRAAMATSLRELQGIASDFARSAIEEAAGQERLQTAISNTGTAYDDVSRRMESLIARGVDLKFADDQVVEGMTRLVTITGDTGVAMDNLAVAMDFARARNIDLATASDIVGKVAAGNTSILSRYGIVLEEGASSAEALAMMQQRVAGQADTYAASTRGWIDGISNSIADFGENLFSQNQELQTFLALMPGVNAAYSVLAGAVTGMGGIGALGRIAGPLALLAGGGALAYGYAQNDLGSTSVNTGANEFFLSASQLLNWGIPFANPFNTQKYVDQMDANEIGDLLNSYFNTGGEGADTVISRANYAFGSPGLLAGGSNFDAKQMAAYIEQEAARLGMTSAQFVNWVVTGNQNLVRDPVSGAYMGVGQYSAFANTRYIESGGQVGSGATTMNFGQFANLNDPYNGRGVFAPPGIDYGLAYPSNQAGSLPPIGGAGAVANSTYMSWTEPVVLSPDMQAAKTATEAKMATDALIAQNQAYEGLITGINSASDAQRAFWGTQQLVIEEQSVYSQQQSEYGQQLGALEAGYDILQQRQAEGIALTKEEQDFLAKYPGYYDRLSGGVEDATVAAALWAGQYAENMVIGDEMNRMIGEQTGATGELVDTIELLILSLNGIPDEVRTKILLDNDQAMTDLNNYLGLVWSVPGTISTALTIYPNLGTDVNNFLGGGRMLGGMIPAALHGRVMGGGYTLVGEAGPELIAGGQGGMVIPASATRARRQQGDAGMHFHGPMSVTVVANNPQQFTQQLREQYIGGARQ